MIARSLRILGPALILSGCGASIHTSRPDDDSADDDSTGADDDTSPDDDSTADDDSVADDDATADDDTATGDDDTTPLPPAPWETFLLAFTDPLANLESRQDTLDGIGRTGSWPWSAPDGRTLFATCWPDAPGAVSVVGDFDAWDPSAHPSTATPDGLCFFAVVEHAAPLVGKYKWHAAPDTWRAPPESTAYGFDTFGGYGWVAAPAAEPWLERLPMWPGPGGDPPRTIRASFPAGFQAGGAAAETMRVLVLHDGQNVFGPEAPFGGWRVETTLAGGAWGDVVAVAVDSVADRLDTYGHVIDLHPVLGQPRGGGADAYIDWLFDDVMPNVRARWGLSEEPVLLAGSSMGGLVTLWAAMRRADELSCAAAMSPSLGWGAFDPASDGSSAMLHLWPTEVGHGAVPLYLDNGGGPGSGCTDTDGDGVEEDSGDTDGYCVTAQFRDAIEGLGYSFSSDLAHWWEPAAPHNEAAWRDRFFRPLDFCATASW